MKSEYTPDNWVVFKVKDDPHYRILAGWSDGYFSGDSWRISSGITRVEKETDSWKFYGSSGSYYEGRMNNYMLRMNTAHVWAELQELHGDKVEMMPEDTDWLTVDWGIE